MVKLNAAALSTLSPSVSVPEYDPTTLTSGIVHFGVGGFHRSHEAMYLDRLLNAGGRPRVGHLRRGRAAPRRPDARRLADQDNLYTLVTKSPDGEPQARVIGAINEYLFAPDAPEAVIEKLADPATSIVSLTVTEGGYSVNNVTGEFEASSPDIQHDLQRGRSAAERCSGSSPRGCAVAASAAWLPLP